MYVCEIQHAFILHGVLYTFISIDFLYVLFAIVCSWTMSKRSLDLISCITEENIRRKKRMMLFSELYFAIIVVVVDYVS